MNIKDKKITVIGFGNQAEAWALNLTDSGYNVNVALRAGSKSIGRASDYGFEVTNIKKAFIHSDILCILIPDEAQPELFSKYGYDMDEGQSIVFAHGFNVHYKLIQFKEESDIVLLAPKGTGKSLRKLYNQDSGVPAAVGVHKDHTGNAWKTVNELAQALGCHKAGIHRSSFKEETEINLFTEQALYMTIFPEAIRETYRLLVEAGYPQDMSYYETLHKSKTMSDLAHRYGLYEYYSRVSSVARSGGILQRGRLVNENTRKEMKKILKEIQDGTFLKKLREENESGSEQTKRFLADIKESPFENTGKLLREKLFKHERQK